MDRILMVSGWVLLSPLIIILLYYTTSWLFYRVVGYSYGKEKKIGGSPPVVEKFKGCKYFVGVPRKSKTGSRDQTQRDANFEKAFIWWCKLNNVNSSFFEDWVTEALTDNGYFNLKYEWYVYRRLCSIDRYSRLINKGLGDKAFPLDKISDIDDGVFTRK